MAKIILGPVQPDSLPHHRGAIYTRDTRYGPVVQAWPTRRKKTNDRQSVWWRGVFSIAAKMAADPISLDYQTAVEMVKGTEMVPRDWLMKCAYGTAYEIVMPDGQVLAPSYKGPPELDPDNPTVPPEEPEEQEMAWEWSLWDRAWTEALSSSNYAFKGAVITPTEDVQVKGIRVISGADSGKMYRLLVTRMQNAYTLGDIVLSADMAAPRTDRQLFEVIADLTLSKATDYCIMFGGIDQGPTYAMPIPFVVSTGFLWPVIHKSMARIMSDNPQPGNTIDQYTTATIPFAFKLKV